MPSVVKLFGANAIPLQNRQVSTAVANIMANMAKALPSYAWLTALPQLISRICHSNPEVNTVTNHIITHVAEAYPQQVSIHVQCPHQTLTDHFITFVSRHILNRYCICLVRSA